jgi:hypothetical protein
VVKLVFRQYKQRASKKTIALFHGGVPSVTAGTAAVQIHILYRIHQQFLQPALDIHYEFIATIVFKHMMQRQNLSKLFMLYKVYLDS